MISTHTERHPSVVLTICRPWTLNGHAGRLFPPPAWDAGGGGAALSAAALEALVVVGAAKATLRPPCPPLGEPDGPFLLLGDEASFACVEREDVNFAVERPCA